MSYAASTGRKALIDQQTRRILWIEGPANHTAPTSRYPGAEIVTLHEPVTLGRSVEVGQIYP